MMSGKWPYYGDWGGCTTGRKVSVVLCQTLKFLWTSRFTMSEVTSIFSSSLYLSLDILLFSSRIEWRKIWSAAKVVCFGKWLVKTTSLQYCLDFSSLWHHGLSFLEDTDGYALQRKHWEGISSKLKLKFDSMTKDIQLGNYYNTFS